MMVHMSIDNDEQLEKMCDKCKKRGEGNKCIACGDPFISESEANPQFDEELFEKLKRDHS